MKKIFFLLAAFLCLTSCKDSVNVVDYVFSNDITGDVIGYTNMNEYFDIQSVDCELDERTLFVNIKLKKNDTPFKVPQRRLKYLKYKKDIYEIERFQYMLLVDLRLGEDMDRFDYEIELLNPRELFEEEREDGDTFTLKCEAKLKLSKKEMETLLKEGVGVELLGCVNEQEEDESEDDEDEDEEDKEENSFL